VVVDLETTGLSTSRAAVLEIGAVRVSRLRLLDSFETLVRPTRSIPPGITALTGIDGRLVARAPGLAEAMGRFRAWLDRAPGAPFVAHNARFDESFVRRDFAVLGLAGLATPVLCTRLLARRLLPELRRYGLDSLSARFGIENPARHRALGDALATARALVEMLRLAPARAGVATLGELLALAAPRPRRPRRPAARPAGSAAGPSPRLSI
jgi:DNA polymerase-3 subunit epsilon